MKGTIRGLAALAVCALTLSPAISADKYWVGSSPNPTPSGNWDLSTANWSSTPDGSSLTTWADFDIAYFSAGTGATGSFTVNVIGTQSPDGLIFEEGNVTLQGDMIDFLGTVDVQAGASARINNVFKAPGFTKTGIGTLTLAGDNNVSPDTTLNGTITVEAGKLFIPSGAPAGVLGNTTNNTITAAPTANTVINPGATIEITGTFNSPDRLFLGGDGLAGGGALRKTGNNLTIQKGGIHILGDVDHARITAAEGQLYLASTGAQNVGRAAGAGTRNLVFDGAGNINTTAGSQVVDGTTYSNFNIAIGSSRVVKEGTGTLTLGGISSWFGGITIKEGIVSVSADTTGAGSQQLGQTSTDGTGGTAEYKPAGVILDGGTLRYTNAPTPTNASGNLFSNAHRGMQIGPDGGTVEVATNLVVFNSSIRKVPGTESRVTLTKSGAAEFRYNGNTTHLRHDTDFDQLVVNQGLFRLGSVSGQDTELGFGAAPAVFTPDAIVLNGGAIGTSFGVTLNANRGITFGPNGGSFNVSAGSMVVPGAITGVGALNKNTAGTLTVQGANTYSGGTNVSAGTLAVSTSTGSLGSGDVAVTGGVLQLSSTTIDVIADTATLSITAAGEVNLAAGLNELVAALVLDGITQPGGTYGSSSSGAQFQLDSYFAGAGILTVPGGGLTGDYNNDGKVDAADYVLWRKTPDNFGGTPGGYNDWKANFGTGPGAGSGSGELAASAAVPEPATLALVLAGLAAAAFTRRSR